MIRLLHPLRERRHRMAVILVAAAISACGWVAGESVLRAAPINPKVFKDQFEQARKKAEVVAKVRVLAAVCTGRGKVNKRAVTLQLCLQVLDVEKGPVKKNDVLVVSRGATPPGGPGPRAYSYMAEVRQFPLTPGVRGAVALVWSKNHRRWVALAGWVPEPNEGLIPTKVGKAVTAGDAGKTK